MSTPPFPHLPPRAVAAAASARGDALPRSLDACMVEQFSGPLADLQAQRLWMLERAAPRPDDDVCHFAGAVLVLWGERVYGVIVRSPEADRASDIPLREGRLRLNLERDAFKFDTLDDAIAGMERARRALLLRGWIDAVDATP